MPDQPGGITPIDLLAGGLPLVGGIYSAIAQSAANRSARKFQLKMYDRQRADALSDWNMQNQYNSPEAMMARYEAAGLNKNMIYGQGTQASTPIRASQSGNYNPKAPEIDLGGVTQSILQSRMQNAQIGNLEKQREIMESEKKLKDAQTLSALTSVDKTKLGMEVTNFDLWLKQTLAPYTLEGKMLENKKTEAGIFKTLADTQFTIDENTRKELLLAGSLKMQLEIIANAQQGRAESKARIANMEKDGLIKQFEIELNKRGFTKNDPYYFRVLNSFLKDPAKVVEELKKANPLDGKNYPADVNPGMQQIF